MVAAGAAVACARASDVLGAAVAGVGLGVLGLGVWGLAIVAPAVGGRCGLAVILLHVEGTGDFGRGLDDHHIEVALFNGSDFFAAREQTKHTAFDGDALT